MIKDFDKWLKIYSCKVERNVECIKSHCAKEKGYGCTNTTQYKYAKRTPLNILKKLINQMRGEYKYE